MVRIHMVHRISKRQRRSINNVGIGVVGAELNWTRGLTVSSKTLVSRRGNIAQLRNRYLGALLRLGLGDLIIGISQEVGQLVKVSIGSDLGVVVVGLIVMNGQRQVRRGIDIRVHSRFRNVVVVLLVSLQNITKLTQTSTTIQNSNSHSD